MNNFFEIIAQETTNLLESTNNEVKLPKEGSHFCIREEYRETKSINVINKEKKYYECPLSK